jgi:hypothetical protein
MSKKKYLTTNSKLLYKRQDHVYKRLDKLLCIRRELGMGSSH